MPRNAMATLLLLGACTPDGATFAPSPAEFLDGSEVEGHTLVGSFGVTPHRGLVRAHNRFGAGVAADEIEVTVDGLPATVAFDDQGYGGLTLDRAGVFEITDGTQAATIHTIDSPWPGVDLHDAWTVPLANAEWVGSSTRGMVVAAGQEVWWAGDDLAAHQVLTTADPIQGMRTRHIDVDGVVDALVWTADTVFLLKGRAGGGMSFGGAMVAEGLGVGGVDIGDLSDDNLPDIAIAWTRLDGTGLLDVWEGDGLFQFVAAEPRGIPGSPSDVDIADATNEGLAQITVLHDTGSEWSRYIRAAERQYIQIGPFMPLAENILSPASKILSSGDINADGGADIAVIEPRVSGSPRVSLFFDILTDVPTCADVTADGQQCVSVYLELGEDAGAEYVVEDGDNDPLDEVWILDELGNLFGVYWDPLEGHQKIRLGTLPEPGPFAVGPWDAEGLPTLVVAGETAWWRWFADEVSGPDTFWRPQERPDIYVREAVLPPFGFVTLEPLVDPKDPKVVTPTTDIVHVTHADGGTDLKVVSYVDGDGRASQQVRVNLHVNPQTITDLQVCADMIWVAAGGRAYGVPPSPERNNAGWDGATVTYGKGVTKFSCDPPQGDVAVLLEDGRVIYLTDTGAEVDTIYTPGARALAVGDIGNGIELMTCSTLDCSVAFWPYGAAGEAVFVISDRDGTRAVDALGAQQSMGANYGNLTVADVDLDGNVDLVGLDPTDSLIFIHRSNGVSIPPAELFHSDRRLLGRVHLADGNRDGLPEMWMTDEDQDLRFSGPRGGQGQDTTDN